SIDGNLQLSLLILSSFLSSLLIATQATSRLLLPAGGGYGALNSGVLLFIGGKPHQIVVQVNPLRWGKGFGCDIDTPR
ncbi:MAG: hypothetical protein ACOVSW_12510, partial [Candidatus Kapaibacteriota bacterium]